MFKRNILLIFLLILLLYGCQTQKEDYKNTIYEITANSYSEEVLESKIDSVTQIIQSGNEENKLIRGYLFVSLGKQEKAQKDFDDIVKKYPNNTYGYMGLGILNLSDEDIAFKYFNKAISLDKKNSLAYFWRSIIQKNDKDRLADRDTTIKIDPDCSMYYCLRADQYHSMDSIDLAIQDYKKSISFDKPYPLSFVLLGLLYEEQSKYKEALDSYNQLVKRTSLQRLKRVGYESIGQVYYELGNYNQAIMEYKKAIKYKGTKLSTSDASFYYKISQNYCLLNEKDSVYKYLNLAVSMDKDLVKYLKEEKNFNNVKYKKWFKELIKKNQR